jgi:hypothetical protein
MEQQRPTRTRVLTATAIFVNLAALTVLAENTGVVGWIWTNVITPVFAWWLS